AGRLVVGLSLSPAFGTDQTAFTISLDAGVERSTDGGKTWQTVNEGLPTVQIPTLGVSPSFADDRTLFAGCAEGLFRSTNAGEAWETIGEALTGKDMRSVVLSSDFANDQTLFVATGENQLLRSTNGGTTWTPTKNQIHNEEIVSLAVSPGFDQDHAIFVGTYSVDQKTGTGMAGVWRGDESGDKLVIQTTYRTTNRWVTFGIPKTFAGTGMFFVGIHNAVLRPMLPSLSAEGFSR